MDIKAELISPLIGHSSSLVLEYAVGQCAESLQGFIFQFSSSVNKSMSSVSRALSLIAFKITKFTL